MAITALQDQYGRYVTAAEVDYGDAVAGDLVACVFDPLPSPMWVKRVRVWLGRSSGVNATLRAVVYDTDTSKNPTDRMGYTASQTVSTAQTGTSGGAAYEANLTQIDTGPSTTALLVPAGTRPSVGFLVTDAPVTYSMRQASGVSGDNEQFYTRSGLSQPPPDPIGAYSNSVQGHLSAALVGEYNVAPLEPTLIGPSGSTSSLTPTFSGTHRDLNGVYGDSSGDGVDRGDLMKRYHISVRRVSDGVVFWSAYFDATSGERASGIFSQVYAGTTLVRGTAYEWRARTKDDADEWGDSNASWTTFTPSAQGTITLDADPTGKQEVISGTTLNFDGKWTHATASNLVKVQVKLYDQGTVGPGGTGLTSSVLVDTSPEITLGAPVASSAAPGTAFEALFADCGFTLSWGKRYGYSIRGYDALGNWSDYSAIRSFNTDDPPSVPTSVLPNGSTITSYPQITCIASDDDDDTGTGLAVSAVITRPDLSTVTVSMTYDGTLYGGAGGWKYQTSAVEITATGTYYVKCRSYDGTVYSGGTTVLGDATYSSDSTFTYATGPAITFVTPTDGGTLTESSPTIAWTCSTSQVQRRVTVTNVDTGSVLINEGWVTTSVATYTFPVGGITDGLDNVSILVEVVDTSALTGSNSIMVSVAYTPPASLTGVDVATVSIRNDPWNTACRVRWDGTALGSTFGGTLVRRRWTADDADTAIIVAEITNASVTEWIDHHAPAGDELTYSVSQYERQTSGETVESARVEVPVELDLQGFVMASVTDPTNARAALRFVQSFGQTLVQKQRSYDPLSGSTPIGVSGSSKYFVYALEALVIDETTAGGVTARELRDDLLACQVLGGTYSIRDDVGLRTFVRIETFDLKRRRRVGWIFTATFKENRYTEGVI